MRYRVEGGTLTHGGSQTAVLLPFVLVSFAANSLVTRYVVAGGLLDNPMSSSVGRSRRCECAAVLGGVQAAALRVAFGQPGHHLRAAAAGCYRERDSPVQDAVGVSSGAAVCWGTEAWRKNSRLATRG